jgi:hypothetical protein
MAKESIKLPFHLSDIVHPHPIMIVGGHHDILAQTLLASRSMPKLKKANYSTCLVEHCQEERQAMRINKQTIQLSGGICLSTEVLDNKELFTDMALCWQIEDLGMICGFADSSLKLSPGYTTGYLHYDQAIIYERHNERETKINQFIRNAPGTDTFSRVKSFFKPSLVQSSANRLIREALTYASLGPKTFDNYHKTSVLSADQKEYIAKAGLELRTHYEAQLVESEKVYYLEERNLHIADKLASAHRSSPRTKKLSLNGYSHVHNGASADSAYGRCFLGSLLREKYAIKSTSVMFALPRRVTVLNDSLKALGLQAELFDPGEFLSIAEVFAPGINVAEAYFATTKTELSVGIHPVSEPALKGLDYALVMPEIPNEDCFEAIKTKTAYVLGLL